MSRLAKPDGLQWRDFEALCLILLEHDFDAPDANFYGRRGVGQNGIDIRMTTMKGGVSAQVVVQCKAMKSVSWSDFADDFEAAIRAFASEALEVARDLRFIVATTADGVNQEPIDKHKTKLLQKLGMEADANRIHLEIYTWPKLESIAEKNEALHRLFFVQDRPADKFPTQVLNQLVARLALYSQDKLLSNAFDELKRYMRMEKPEAADKFHWAPTALFDPLADVFLAAGDFHNASRLLSTALGTNPLNAKYLLGYLRAQRVLHAVPIDNCRRNYPFEQPETQRPAADEVEEMGEQLLRARGDIDIQLTLALWVVSYAPKQALADAGLRRALGLVTQAWPDGVARLERDASYTVTDEGYIVKLPDAYPLGSAALEVKLRACALAVAYMYARALYTARFDSDACASVEHAFGSWPWCEIEDVTGEDPFLFFARMAPACSNAVQTYLPSFYVEASGREFDPLPGDPYGLPFPPPFGSSIYVTTPEFLLHDSVGGLVERRIAEFQRAGFMGQEATILISHLGLERLARAQLGFTLKFVTQGQMGQCAGPVVTAIGSILARVVRQEFSPHYPHGRPSFASDPSYENFGKQRLGDSLDASLELSRRKSAPFLAVSANELAFAGSELSSKIQRFAYWKPTHAPLTPFRGPPAY